MDENIHSQYLSYIKSANNLSSLRFGASEWEEKEEAGVLNGQVHFISYSLARIMQTRGVRFKRMNGNLSAPNFQSAAEICELMEYFINKAVILTRGSYIYIGRVCFGFPSAWSDTDPDLKLSGIAYLPWVKPERRRHITLIWYLFLFICHGSLISQTSFPHTPSDPNSNRSQRSPKLYSAPARPSQVCFSRFSAQYPPATFRAVGRIQFSFKRRPQNILTPHISHMPHYWLAGMPWSNTSKIIIVKKLSAWLGFRGHQTCGICQIICLAVLEKFRGNFQALLGIHMNFK